MQQSPLSAFVGSIVVADLLSFLGVVGLRFNWSRNPDLKDASPKEKAKRVVKERILQGSTTGKSVRVSPTPLSSGTIIRAKEQILLRVPAIGNSTKLWFFFIDDDPESSFEEHPCRYVLVDDEGQWVVFDESLPPDMRSQMELVV